MGGGAGRMSNGMNGISEDMGKEGKYYFVGEGRCKVKYANTRCRKTRNPCFT